MGSVVKSPSTASVAVALGSGKEVSIMTSSVDLPFKVITGGVASTTLTSLIRVELLPLESWAV